MRTLKKIALRLTKPDWKSKAMINLLELTKKQVLVISAVTVVVGIVGLASAAAYTGNQLKSLDIEPAAKAISNAQPTQDAPGQPQVAKPVTNATKPETPVQASPAQPQLVKTEPQDGGHIPFTNEPVTPGDPASYVDTVGQCPFYEMAGPKGCTPPADIICNEDWTVCEPK